MVEKQISQPVTSLKICNLISTAVHSLQSFCQNSHVEISYARRNRDYVVYASQNTLQTIISTLLENAIQFAGHGGTLHIEHERIRGKRHNDRSDFIKIGMRICGPGVFQNMFDVVIDKFQNIDKLLCEKPTKTISLTLARTQAEIFQLGGNIWIRSDLGRGLTFFFTIPIEKQKKEEKDSKSGKVTIVSEL